MRERELDKTISQQTLNCGCELRLSGADIEALWGLHRQIESQFDPDGEECLPNQRFEQEIISRVSLLKRALYSDGHFNMAALLLTKLADHRQISVKVYTAVTEVLGRNLPLLEDKLHSETAYESCHALEALGILSSHPTKLAKRAVATLMRHDGVIVENLKQVPTCFSARRAVEGVLDGGDKEQREKMIQQLTELIDVEPDKTDDLVWLFHSSTYHELRSLARRTTIKRLAAYGLQPEKLMEAWRESDARDAENQDQKEYAWVLRLNLGRIIELEKERPGSTKYLAEEFDIQSFGRYPREILLRQFDERENTSLPYGIFIFPKYDRNGTFYTMPAISELAWELENDYLIRVVEVGSNLELVKTLRKLNQKYGRGQKIAFGLICAHGSADSLTWGRNHQDKTMTEDLDHRLVNRLLKYFTDHPIFIFFSCLTGRNFAQVVSEKMGAKVYAPDGKGGPGEIVAINLPTELQISYIGPGIKTIPTRVFDRGKEIIEQPSNPSSA